MRISRTFANEIEITLIIPLTYESSNVTYSIHEDIKNQQVVVNRPQTGPKNFKFDLNTHKWQSITNDTELKILLKEELSIMAGRDLCLY